MSDLWELRLAFFATYLGIGFLWTRDFGAALVVSGIGYLVLVILNDYRQSKKARAALPPEER